MIRYFNSKQAPFVFVTAAVLLALVLPDLLQHGMFMDGTQYAIISKNYADGKGTFWFPFLSTSWENRGQNYFLEHPPLIYFLQSFFFKAFNGNFLSERMYCLFTLLLSAWLIKLLWELLFEEQQDKKELFWLPVLLWIITPSVFWSYKNNMHENTVTVFVLASVFFAIKSLCAFKNQILFLILSSLFIFLGTLSKGLPALFPLASIALWKFVKKDLKWKTIVAYTAVMFMIPFCIYVFLIRSNPEIEKSLSFYFFERLLYRVENIPQVENRFTVLFWLLTDLLVPVGVCVLAFLYLKWKGYWQKNSTPNNSLFYFTFAIGMCGVLPLAFTHVQRAVYFVPAIPFLAIALAITLIEPLLNLAQTFDVNSLSFKIWRNNMLFAIIGVMILSMLSFGKVSRDNNEFQDAMVISKIVGENNSVSVSFDQYQQWGFQFYLLRYHNITMNYKNENLPYKVALTKELVNDSIYEKVNIQLKTHNLFKRKN